jgi:MarR family transcriptional regulator, 2-MHQ and catechol-resistance regulon repressor
MNAPNASPAAAAGRSENQELALKLWVVLARAHAAVQDHLQADVAANGLTLAEFGILEVLYHKGPLLLGDVQRRILVSSGGVTYLVDRLEKKGLVERRECPEDRRARYAALTPAGEELISRIFPRHALRIEEVLGGLGAEEKREAIRLLRELGHAAAAVERPVREG